MKKWIRFSIVTLSCFLTFAWIINLKYDLNLYEYLNYSLPLTKTEKEYLKEKGNIVCGSDQSARPISYINNENGRYEGLIIDYMSFLSVDLGVDFDCKALVWADVMEELRSGEVDTADLFPSKERKEHFIFSQSIYSLRGVVAVRKQGKNVQSLMELAQEKIAVVEGDFVIEYIKDHIKLGVKMPEVVLVSDIETGIALLENGDVEGIAGDEVIIDYGIKEMNTNSLKILDRYLYEKNVTLAVREEEKQLLSILNKGILSLKKKDILMKTQQKWFGVSAPIMKDSLSYEWISRGMLLIMALFLVLFLWSDTLQRKIRDKTKELELSKSKLRTIIDALHIYLFVIDGKKEISDCNQAAEHFLKKSRKDIVGTTFFDNLTLSEIYEKAAIGQRKIKEHYYVVTERQLDDCLDSRLITIEDVTEKRINENKLRQESKMIAVGQLSAGLAHEIRNPLGLIKNYMYVIKKYVTNELGMHAMMVIDNSVGRINQLIENLLSFSRLGNESDTITDVEKLILGIVELEGKKLRELGISFEVNCGALGLLLLNEEALKIILFNLIDNAADALKNVEKEVKKILLEVRSIEDAVYIQVRDNGCGMEESKLETIFNPFFTTKDNGTGLGLYIVSFELDNINGIMGVESHLNEGTIFELTIPVKEVPGEDC